MENAIEKSDLSSKLKSWSCHYNWNYNQEKFQERLERNIATCKSHIEDTPDPTVFNFLGFLYAQQKRYTNAEKAFQDALKLVPDEPVALANLAHFYYEQGRLVEAEDYVNKLEKLEKSACEVWQHWSKAYFHVRLFEYEEAAIQYDKATPIIEHLPKEYRYRIYLYKGIILNRIAKTAKKPQKFKEANIALNEALALNQSDHTIFCHLAIAHTKNFKLASQYFDKALKLKPDDATTLKFFGKFLQKSENSKKEALLYFNQSIKNKESSSAYHNRGILYRETKEFIKAEQDFEKAVELEPSNFPANIDLINIYKNNKHYQAALTLCTELIKNIKKPPIFLLFQRAELLDKTGNQITAIFEFEKLLGNPNLEEKIREKTKKNLVSYYSSVWKKDINYFDKYIQLLLKFGDMPQALLLAQEGVSCHLEHFLAYYHYGCLLIAQKEYQKGADALVKAFNLTVDLNDKKKAFAKIKETYVALLSQQRELKEAENKDNAAEAKLIEIEKYLNSLLPPYIELENQLHKDDRPIWHSNFKLFYSSKKPKKAITIKGDEIHKKLRKEIKEWRQTQFASAEQQPPGGLNYANATLSFIVSDSTHEKDGKHDRILVSIPLLARSKTNVGSVQHVSNYYKFFDFQINKNQHVPRSADLLHDVLISKPLAKAGAIIDKYYKNKVSEGFHREFHCSERALYGFLKQPEVIDEIIDNIEAQCANQIGLKISAIVIDIYSDRYLCFNCEESAFYWYAPDSEFIEKLTKALQARGHKVQTKSGTLDVIMRVSAEKPANKQSVQNVAQHIDEIIDIKKRRTTHSGVLLLERDDASLENSQSTSQKFTNFKRFNN